MTKNSTSLTSSLATLFVGLMLVVTSCTKEPMVAPGGSPMLGAEKGLSVPDPGSTDAAEGIGRSDDKVPAGGPNDGISDDGDDLSDTERNRKKQ